MAAKRTALAALLFVLIAGAVFGLCAAGQKKILTLENGDNLPEEIAARQYRLAGLEYSEEEEAFCFELNVPKETKLPEHLLLSIGDFSYYKMQINGSQPYEYTGDDPYCRTSCVEINTAELLEDGRLILRFYGGVWNHEDAGSASELDFRAPNLLHLSGEEHARHVRDIASGLTMLFCGVFALLIVSNLTLFLKKRSETYLLLLAFASAAVLLAALISAPAPLIQVNRRAFLLARPSVVAFPIMMNAIVCVTLLKNALPPRAQSILKLRNLLAASVVPVVIQLFVRRSLYDTMQLLSFLPAAYALFYGCRKKEPGCWLLLVGCAVFAGITVRVAYAETVCSAAAGEISIYLRNTETGHVAFLLSCMSVINLRFSGKFQESEDLNRTLDATVEMRTRQLVKEQEQRHTMMLNVFHDLRSPLVSLSDSIERLPAGTEEEASRRAGMERKAGFLKHLIDDLFLLSKLEESQLPFEGDEVELSALAQELAESFRPLAAQKRIAVQTAVEEAVWVWGDAVRLEQILQNLLDNAVTYTPEGGTIRITLERREGTVFLEVYNSGSRIREEDLPYVFERYYHASRSEHSKSTGIGLAIARMLTQMHHGTISVQNAQAGGVLFRVELPALEQDA